MHRFCFSKRSDVDRISEYWEIRNFLKKSMILKKECIALFPTLASIKTRGKELDSMKKRDFFSIHERNRECSGYILEVTLSVHFGKIKKSHVELVFLFFCYCFSFFFFSYFVFARTFFNFSSCETQRINT